MRKLRCLLGWHGPYYTSNIKCIGRYSRAFKHGMRVCPFCQTQWRNYGTLDQWRVIPPDIRDIDWMKNQ